MQSYGFPNTINNSSLKKITMNRASVTTSKYSRYSRIKEKKKLRDHNMLIAQRCLHFVFDTIHKKYYVTTNYNIWSMQVLNYFDVLLIAHQISSSLNLDC